MAETPPPPPGFELEPTTAGVPPPPPGFEIEPPMTDWQRTGQTALGAGKEVMDQAVAGAKWLGKGVVQNFKDLVPDFTPEARAKRQAEEKAKIENIERVAKGVGHAVAHPGETYDKAVDATSRWMDKALKRPQTPEEAQERGRALVQGAETILPVGGAARDVAKIGAGLAERALAPAAEKIAARGEAKAAAANLEKAAENERITRLKAMGYSQAPTTGGGGLAGRAGEAISGQLETEYQLSRKNARVSNRKAADDLGIGKGQALSEDTVEAKKQEAFKVYDRVRNASKTTGRVVADEQYSAELDAVRERTGQEAADFPDDVNEAIEKEIAKFSVKDADSSSLLAKVKKLRERASKNMRGEADAFELGIAQKKIATAMENLLDRHLERTSPDLIKDFRSARTQLAKIYSVEDALTPNGNISPAVLARQLKRGVPLSGGLKDIAEAYQMNKRAMRTVDDLGGKGEFSRLDVLVGGAEMLVHPAKAGLIAAGLGARPVARAIITSKPYQRAAIGPRITKPSLLSRAARNVADAGERSAPQKAASVASRPKMKVQYKRRAPTLEDERKRVGE